MVYKYLPSALMFCQTASLVILVVLLLRLLFRKAPKKYMCILWMVVLFRLLCPITIEGPIPASWWAKNAEVIVLPETEPIAADKNQKVGPLEEPALAGGLSITDFNIEENDETTYIRLDVPDEKLPTTYLLGFSLADSIMLGASALWAIGTLIFLTIGVCQYIGIRKKLKRATICDEGLRESSEINSPMVFGIFLPDIYLPTQFRAGISEKEYEFILLHEKAHVRRRDNLLKILSFLALSIHWWNPFVWISMIFFQKDIEMACDEYVMSQMEEDVRKEYAQTLLHFSMNKSGLFFPTAFGESNTESRIKNILKYKKKPIYITVGILVIICLAAICLATNPRQESPKNDDLVEVQEETKEFDQDVIVYDSLEQMNEEYFTRWQERLVSEGKINSASDLKSMKRDAAAGYSYISSINFEPVDYEVDFTYYTVDENYFVTFYKTFASLRVRDMVIYVSKEVEEAYESVTSAEQAERMGIIYYISIEATGEDWGIGQKLQEKGLLSSSFLFKGLEEPETALPLLLHLDGGKSEKVGVQDGEVYVRYTFADGTHINYSMRQSVPIAGDGRMGFYWFPDGVPSDDIIDSLNWVKKYISEVKAEELISVTREPDYTNEDWLYLDNKFVLLHKMEGQDVALYGLYGCDGMVLREGDKVYPILMSWWTRTLPEIFQADYDQDGDLEYSFRMLVGAGTGVAIEQVYMLEVENESLVIKEFTDEDMSKQLDRVTGIYDKETRQIEIFVDGANTGKKLHLPEDTSRDIYTFKRIWIGDFMSYTEEGGTWMLEARIGIVVDEQVSVIYDDDMIMKAPVVYHKDGAFALGEISVDVLTYELP